MLKEFSSSTIFKGLNEITISGIIQNGFIKSYANGEVILEEGSSTQQFHIVISGFVKVIKGNKEKEKILGFLKKGDFYGEMSIILKKPHNATIISKEKTSILVFLEEEFQKYFLSNNTIIRNITNELAKRLSSMDIEVLNLAYSSIENRLRNYIWFITEKGTKTADIVLTHHEISQIIGTNRETITKLLNDMKNNRLIRLSDGKKISVLNISAFNDL